MSRKVLLNELEECGNWHLFDYMWMAHTEHKNDDKLTLENGFERGLIKGSGMSGEEKIIQLAMVELSFNWMRWTFDEIMVKKFDNVNDCIVFEIFKDSTFLNLLPNNFYFLIILLFQIKLF